MCKTAWAKVRMVWTAVAVTVLGLFAVFSVSAQEFQQPRLVQTDGPMTVAGITCRYRLEGRLPSSSAARDFSLWQKMHPHTFEASAESFAAQCRATIGKVPWLTEQVCEDFKLALQQGSCAVVQEVNNIDIDVVRGKRNQQSTAFLGEHMQLQEPRQAIFVSLPGDLWLGMFAGEEGKSCNNFFALQEKPEEVVVPPPLPPPPPQGKWVCVNTIVGQEEVNSSVAQHADAFVLRDGCCCGRDTFVPAYNFRIEGTVQSGSGYSERCHWVESNPTGEIP